LFGCSLLAIIFNTKVLIFFEYSLVFVENAELWKHYTSMYEIIELPPTSVGVKIATPTLMALAE